MLYIFDTDHLSLLQRQHAVILARLQSTPIVQCTVTVISLVEQVQGRLAALSRAKNEDEAARACHYLLQTVEYFRPLLVLPYNVAAVAEFERLRHQKIRIGTQDLRIAAIALSQQATIVTRNLRDFGQVPDLQVQDWSEPQV